MKLTAFILFTMISACAHAQNYLDQETGVAAGVSAGYSSKQCLIGTLTMGAMFAHHNHVSINLTALGKQSDSDIPAIGEFRIGHGFNNIEIYGGVAYHYASSDGEKFISQHINGWKPAAGIVFKFPETPYTISAGFSGNIYSIQLGIFGVR